MSSKMRSGKTVWVAAAAAILVILLVILLAVKSTRNGQDTIVLPTPSVDSNGDHNLENEADAEGDFIEITNENVATVLQTLSRPSSYRQSYTVTVGTGEKKHQKTVSLWCNYGIIHAEIAFGQQIQSIITDGSRLYLWYDHQRNYVSLQVGDELTVEDILGLPDFDAYLNLSPSSVTDSKYLILEEAQVSCIYVSSSYAEKCEARYWVNLENGLMYQAEAVEAEKTVYTIQQTAFDLLAAEDEGFSDKFVLPDGTIPFTSETKMQQP